MPLVGNSRGTVGGLLWVVRLFRKKALKSLYTRSISVIKLTTSRVVRLWRNAGLRRGLQKVGS